MIVDQETYRTESIYNTSNIYGGLYKARENQFKAFLCTHLTDNFCIAYLYIK